MRYARGPNGLPWRSAPHSAPLFHRFGLIAGALLVLCGAGSLFQVAIDLFPLVIIAAGTDDFTALVRGILVDGQRAGVVRNDLDAKELARSVVAIMKAISCSRAVEPSRNAFFTKMQTTRTLVLSGIQRSACCPTRT